MEETSYGLADAPCPKESKTLFCFENGRVDNSAEMLRSSANSANAVLICHKSQIILRRTLAIARSNLSLIDARLQATSCTDRGCCAMHTYGLQRHSTGVKGRGSACDIQSHASMWTGDLTCPCTDVLQHTHLRRHLSLAEQSRRVLSAP